MGYSFTISDLSLIVGCPSEAASSISMDFGSTITSLNLAVGSPASNVYTLKFTSLTSAPYLGCKITGKEIQIDSYTDLVTGSGATSN